jgi:hypothetical protein
MSDLLSYVVKQGLHTREPTISEDELVFLRDYDHKACLEPFRSISEYQVTCPDRISQCLHYTALKNLISCLDTTCREKHLYDYRLLDGSALPKGHPRMVVVITDCHTLLDELFGKYDHPLSSLEILTDSLVKLWHVIANNVFLLKCGTIGIPAMG